MQGFPSELRPLLVAVIVLAIAHMLLKGKARAAKAQMAKVQQAKAHAAKAHRARAGRSGAERAHRVGGHEAPDSVSVASESSLQPINDGRSALPDDPVEALTRLRERSN